MTSRSLIDILRETTPVQIEELPDKEACVPLVLGLVSDTVFSRRSALSVAQSLHDAFVLRGMDVQFFTNFKEFMRVFNQVQVAMSARALKNESGVPYTRLVLVTNSIPAFKETSKNTLPITLIAEGMELEPCASITSLVCNPKSGGNDVSKILAARNNPSSGFYMGHALLEALQSNAVRSLEDMHRYLSMHFLLGSHDLVLEGSDRDLVLFTRDRGQVITTEQISDTGADK